MTMLHLYKWNRAPNTDRCFIYLYVSDEFIYLCGVLRYFQHCTGHITTGSWKGRGNQYIQFVRVLYCKLPTNGKHLPAFPLEAVPGIEPRAQRWEARVLPLCHRAPHVSDEWHIGDKSSCFLFVISAKDDMFLGVFICLSVCLCSPLF